MEAKGLIKGVDIIQRAVTVVVESPAEEIEKLVEYIGTEKPVTVKITRFREKRSLDANAYYFVLVRQIAQAKGISEAEYHNRSLAEVGVPFLDADGSKIMVYMKDSDRWLKALPGENHYCPTTRWESYKNGEVWRWYYLLLPSRLMDSKQMATLIDYVVQDAQSLGIQTETPEQIERMKQLWGKEKSNG